MEAAITSPVAGVVERLAIPKTQQVEAGDLLVVGAPTLGCPTVFGTGEEGYPWLTTRQMIAR